MNERIRELKEQAMEWVPNQVDPDTKIRLLNAEKFVQLIVGECVDTVLDSSVEYATRPQIAKELKEHFGVEE